MHHSRDAGNQPHLAVKAGDTVVSETRDVSDDQIGCQGDVYVVSAFLPEAIFTGS